MRTFIAIELDEGIRARLGRLVRELAPKSPGVRFVNPDGIHVTLNFLGEIPDETAEKVKALIAAAAAQSRRFDLRVRGTGTFPENSRSPRVLWVDVEAGPELPALQARLTRDLEPLGFEPEKRDFHPHLTIGRVKGREGLAEAVEGLRAHAADDFGAMTVRKVTLFRSVLRPTGAIYTPVFEAPLP